MATLRCNILFWSSHPVTITSARRIAIGGWLFTAPTGFGGASGFCSWDCACSYPRPEVQGETEPIFLGRPGRHRGPPDLCEHTMAHSILVAGDDAGQGHQGPWPSKPANELLRLITSLPACELEAPCAGGTMVISTQGVSVSMDHDDFDICHG